MIPSSMVPYTVNGEPGLHTDSPGACSVWVGDGNLATIADACITIKLLSHPVPASHSPSSTTARRRKATWRRWLMCQDLQVEEPLLAGSEGPVLQVWPMPSPWVPHALAPAPPSLQATLSHPIALAAVGHPRPPLFC